MKQKIQKKLSLNKKTVTSLGREEMDAIHGASYMLPSCVCSDQSCSYMLFCCPPTGEYLVANATGDCS